MSRSSTLVPRYVEDAEPLVGGGLRSPSLGGLVATLTLGLTVTGAAAVIAPMIGIISAAQATAVAAVTAAGLLAWFCLAVRARGRQQLADRCNEGLTRLLGLRVPERAAVRPRRWRGPRLGSPECVVLRYGPDAIKVMTPEWRDTVLSLLRQHFGADYRIQNHVPRRRSLEAVRTEHEAPEKAPPSLKRAEQITERVFGTTADLAPEVDETGNVTAFEVRGFDVVRFADTIIQRRVERKVSQLLPDRWRSQWMLEVDDCVRFEKRPPLPTMIPHPVAPITDAARYTLPLGQDEDGETIVWNLRGTGPHLMVVGPTGLGKTVLINGVVMEAARRGFAVLIVDPKRIEFLGMRDYPNVQIVASSVVEQIATVLHAFLEMERRYQLIEEGLADESDFEPLLLVLDEYRDFVAEVTEWWDGVKKERPKMPAKCPVFGWVGRLARKARSADIHILLGTQRPDADFLTGEMRDNFNSRASLGNLSPQGAMMMWEAAFIGVALPEVPGRATGVNAAGAPVETQIYWTPDPRRVGRNSNSSTDADRQILEQLRPSSVAHPQLELVMAEEIEDGETTWDLVRKARLEPVDDAAPSTTTATNTTPGTHLSLVPALDEPPAVPASLAEPGDVDLGGDGYGEAEPIRGEDVEPGDLALVDDVADMWAVVIEAGPDVVDEAAWCLDWRSSTGEDGSLTVPPDELLTVRRPLKESE